MSHASQVAAAISRAGVSNRQFSLLRDQIFKQHEPGDDAYSLGRYYPFFYPDTNIELPPPPTTGRITGVTDAIADGHKLTADPSGEAAYIDFPLAVETAIAGIPTAGARG